MPSLSMRICDSPGALIREGKGADFYFQKCDVILIVMDISLVLDHDKIEKTMNYVLK